MRRQNQEARENDDLAYELNPTPETVTSVLEGFKAADRDKIRAALDNQEGELVFLRVDFDGRVFARFANPEEFVKVDWYE